MGRTFLSLLFLHLLISCSADNSLKNRIDILFNDFDSNVSPGASIMIIKSGELVYQKGFGMAHIESKKPIQPATNFRLASITKQFTALSVLLLEEEGKLSIEDQIIEYFPELRHYAKDITIKNILQHTSGFLDYEDFVDDSDTVQLKDKDVMNILASNDSTYVEPGSEHRDSHSGYAILALLVERLSGSSFADFLKSRIFDPLGMRNSVAYEKGISTIPNRAYGYTKTEQGFVFSDQSMTSAVLGDGGIYSSAVDLMKWDEEVNSPTLLSPENFNRVFEKGRNNLGYEFDYGFGWRLDPYKNFKRHYHTGGTKGFSNIYMKLPELDLTIILLMNINDNDAKGYAEKIADLFIENNYQD